METDAEGGISPEGLAGSASWGIAEDAGRE
jgi:hypothetical protein